MARPKAFVLGVALTSFVLGVWLSLGSSSSQQIVDEQEQKSLQVVVKPSSSSQHAHQHEDPPSLTYSDYVTCPAWQQAVFSIRGTSCDDKEDYQQNFALHLWNYLRQDPVPHWMQPLASSLLSSFTTNQTWLFLGTQQHKNIALTLACHLQQQSNQTLQYSMETFDRWTSKVTLTSTASTNTKITLWILADTYAVYSQHHWSELMQQQMQGTPLQDMDLIIAGTHHTCRRDDSTHFTAQVSAAVMRLKRSVEQDLDCFAIAPPSVTAWRQVYQGPVLFLTSSFSDIASQGPILYRQVRQYHNQQQQQHDNPSLLGVLPISYHSDQLIRTISPDAVRGGGTLLMPCLGTFGGLMDLLAWEVADFIQHTNARQHPSPHAPALRHWQLPESVAPDKMSATTAKAAATATDDFHYCSATSLNVRGDPFSPPVPVTYKCKGPIYNAFANTLQQYAQNKDNGMWGKRAWPLPPHTKVLIFGNSHTRQMTEALVCMYGNLLDEIRVGRSSWWYHFANKASFAVVINSPIPFSTTWLERLHEELGLDKENSTMNETFDAIVLGMTNECGGDNTFTKNMIALSRVEPDVDCLHNEPPTLVQWTQHFPTQPILFLPMMTHHPNHDKFYSDLEHLQKTSKQSLTTVDPRVHIDAIRIECGSYNRTEWSDCLPDDSGATHRCQGQRGSHADLIAWSVVEQLYEVLVP